MTIETLTAEEQAYFDNQGEAAPTAKTEQPHAPEKVSEDVVAETIENDSAENVLEEQPERAKQVPHQALHQERERRKAAEERARNQEIALAKLQERLSIFEAAINPQQEQTPPAHEEDFFAAVKHDRNEIENLKKSIEHVARENAQKQAEQQMQFKVASYESEFVKEKPDYLNAVEYLKVARADELRMFGYDEQTVARTIADEARGIAAYSLQNNLNPAQLAYSIAEKRGYRPNAATNSQPDPEKIMKAQTASKSLSGAGSSPTGPMTAERLASMSERDFAAYYAKNPDTVARLSGRG